MEQIKLQPYKSNRFITLLSFYKTPFSPQVSYKGAIYEHYQQ